MSTAADITDLSRQIGALITKTDMLQTSSERMREKIYLIEKQNVRLDMHLASNHKRLNALEPQLRELQDLKNRSQGIIMLAGVIFGAIGGILIRILPLGQEALK